jgi:hypothetical protein
MRQIGLLGNWAHRCQFVGGKSHEVNIGWGRKNFNMIDGLTHRVPQDR